MLMAMRILLSVLLCADMTAGVSSMLRGSSAMPRRIGMMGQPRNTEGAVLLPLLGLGALRADHGGVGPLRLRGGMDWNQLAEFEAILDCLQRPDATPQQRHQAQQFALSLQNPVDLSQVPHEGDAATRRQAAVAKRLAQLQHVLDHSSSHTAQVVACNSLTTLATNHWDNNTLPHLEIRNYCLSFLFAQSADTTVPTYVSRAMTRLLSRVTKLGWLECEAHRGIIKQLERFFDASARHYATGLTLLHDLVEEMDLPATNRRGVILRRQFLLQSLNKAFSLSIDTLLSISSMADANQAAVLGDAALQLAVRCLSFDFYGQSSSVDESDEISVNVPMSWRKDLNNPRLIDLLWSFYQDSSPPQVEAPNPMSFGPSHENSFRPPGNDPNSRP